MATATTSSPHLSDEQLRDVLQLVQGADSVELKLTVPESQQRSMRLPSSWIHSTRRSDRSTSSTRPSSR